MDDCGCKGARFCALCRDTQRVRNLRTEPSKQFHQYANYRQYIYCHKCRQVINYNTRVDIFASITEISIFNGCQCQDTNRSPLSTEFAGLTLIPDFLTDDEECSLVARIDRIDWISSQSGRRKQDYGPKVNFKARKVRTTGCFTGMPDYADMLLPRMARVGIENYMPIEMCNLEYDRARQSAIDFHRDDTWIWGNRLITINLLADSIMTFVDDEDCRLVYVAMPRRSLLCIADVTRYRWKHGIVAEHIVGRRIALTMREAADAFRTADGELFEIYGRELMRLSACRIEV